MINPPSLKPGDKIAIVAPARKVVEAEMQPAIRLIREWGFEMTAGPHLYGSCDQYSGTDEERCSDFQLMLDDPSVKAIICARGGYGTLRIIDSLDFSAFQRNPKWIVGFSDITVLHSHIHSCFGIETLHAAMPATFPAKDGTGYPVDTLKAALLGELDGYSVETTDYAREGKAEGILTGGNLSILYALSGSVSDIQTEGKILFIEDLDEYLYHIDRMMMSLKRSGKLQGLAGMIVGGMTRMNDNQVPFGKSAVEIIAETLAEYHYPVCFGFPAGHLEDNRALILGRKVSLEVNGSSASLKFNQG